jgi:hypothetical protein
VRGRSNHHIAPQMHAIRADEDGRYPSFPNERLAERTCWTETIRLFSHQAVVTLG